jgi:hypothetical protein
MSPFTICAKKSQLLGFLEAGKNLDIVFKPNNPYKLFLEVSGGIGIAVKGRSHFDKLT